MRREWLWALRLAVSAATLALAWRLAGEVGALSRLHDLRYGWLAAGVAANAGIVALLAWRLQLVLRAAGGPVPGGWWLAGLTWASLGLGQVTLGTLGGDAFRVAMLARQGWRWDRALAVVGIDRVIGLFGLLILGSAAAAAALGRTALALPLAVAAVLVAAALAARRIPEGSRFAALRALPQTLGGPRGLAIVALAVAGHALSVLQFHAMARMIGVDPGWLATGTAASVALLAAVLPVSIGGWGVRELSFGAALAMVGAQVPEAATISVLYGILTLTCGLPAGLVALRLLRR